MAKYPEALRPVGYRGSWQRVTVPKQGAWQKRIQGWVYGMLCVISVVETDEVEPLTFHLSVTVTLADYSKQRRATDDEMAIVRKHFRVEIAQEENHVPDGITRNLWIPIPGGN